MRKFRYRLEAVMRLRRIEKDRAMANFAKALQRRLGMEKICRGHAGRLRRIQEQISRRRHKAFHGSLQGYYWGAMQEAVSLLNTARNTVEQARREEEEVLQQFLLAKTKAEALEQLRRKRRQDHYRTETRLEEKVVEDLVNASLYISNS